MKAVDALVDCWVQQVLHKQNKADNKVNKQRHRSSTLDTLEEGQAVGEEGSNPNYGRDALDGLQYNNDVEHASETGLLASISLDRVNSSGGNNSA